MLRIDPLLLGPPVAKRALIIVLTLLRLCLPGDLACPVTYTSIPRSWPIETYKLKSDSVCESSFLRRPSKSETLVPAKEMGPILGKTIMPSRLITKR